jgi:hypothetical protein
VIKQRRQSLTADRRVVISRAIRRGAVWQTYTADLSPAN